MQNHDALESVPSMTTTIPFFCAGYIIFDFLINLFNNIRPFGFFRFYDIGRWHEAQRKIRPMDNANLDRLDIFLRQKIESAGIYFLIARIIYWVNTGAQTGI